MKRLFKIITICEIFSIILAGLFILLDKLELAIVFQLWTLIFIGQLLLVNGKEKEQDEAG